MLRCSQSQAAVPQCPVKQPKLCIGKVAKAVRRRCANRCYSGAGGAFCAGGDVKNSAQTAMADLTFDERLADLRGSQRKVCGRLVAVRKPTIAAIPGAAAGAGLALALACDIRIASQSAVLIAALCAGPSIWGLRHSVAVDAPCRFFSHT